MIARTINWLDERLDLSEVKHFVSEKGVPIHAHVNARLYPYSNVAGTLNLPSTIFENAAAIRHALERG